MFAEKEHSKKSSLEKTFSGIIKYLAHFCVFSHRKVATPNIENFHCQKEARICLFHYNTAAQMCHSVFRSLWNWKILPSEWYGSKSTHNCDRLAPRWKLRGGCCGVSSSFSHWGWWWLKLTISKNSFLPRIRRCLIGWKLCLSSGWWENNLGSLLLASACILSSHMWVFSMHLCGCPLHTCACVVTPHLCQCSRDVNGLFWSKVQGRTRNGTVLRGWIWFWRGTNFLVPNMRWVSVWFWLGTSFPVPNMRWIRVRVCWYYGVTKSRALTNLSKG